MPLELESGVMYVWAWRDRRVVFESQRRAVVEGLCTGALLLTRRLICFLQRNFFLQHSVHAWSYLSLRPLSWKVPYHTQSAAQKKQQSSCLWLSLPYARMVWTPPDRVKEVPMWYKDLLTDGLKQEKRHLHAALFSIQQQWHPTFFHWALRTHKRSWKELFIHQEGAHGVLLYAGRELQKAFMSL